MRHELIKKDDVDRPFWPSKSPVMPSVQRLGEDHGLDLWQRQNFEQLKIITFWLVHNLGGLLVLFGMRSRHYIFFSSLGVRPSSNCAKTSLKISDHGFVS